MKKMIALAAMITLLSSNIAVAEEKLTKEAFIEVGKETIMRLCDFSRWDLESFYIGEAFVTEGPRRGSGRVEAWRMDFTYLDIYYTNTNSLWEIDSVDFMLYMSLDGTEVFEEDDPDAFAKAVEAMRKRSEALRVLEEMETEHGDFTQWPIARQEEYLAKYADSFAVRRADWVSRYPGPEGFHLWDAARISDEAARKRLGLTQSQLSELPKRIDYYQSARESGEPIYQAIIQYNWSAYPTHGPSCTVTIDIETEEIVMIEPF